MIVLLRSLVRMFWVVIFFGETPAKGKSLAVVCYHRYSLTLLVRIGNLSVLTATAPVM